MAINKPSVEELKEKAGSTYTLVVEVSRRTRELVDGAQPLVDPKERKPIGVAIDEIDRGLISAHRKLSNEEA